MAYRASGKGDSPCYGCTERHMGCHSNCLRGIEHSIKTREENKRKREVVQKDKYWLYRDIYHGYKQMN